MGAWAASLAVRRVTATMRKKETGYQYDLLNRQTAKVAKTGYHPKMFDIPLKDGKFDTSQKEAAGKLVKLLCNKGMVDPFEELPVEVSSTRKWQ